MRCWLVVAFALLTACESGAPRAPRPLAVDPAVGHAGVETAVTIAGRDFWLATSASFSSDAIDVDATFTVRLGQTELLDVVYVDSETLTAVVPGSLAAGQYDLLVIDPRGREGELLEAFTVDESVVVPCERDEQCDDGDVCNGLETCPDGVCVQGVDLDCDDDNPCTADSCDSVSGCVNIGDADQDDDGYDAAACGGDDCDDDPAACGDACNPGITSDPCDGYNNDCDLETDEDHVETATSCGVGACASSGVMECVSGAPADTCVPLAGSTEGPSGDPTCSDGIDNDCDGPSDGADSGCNAANNLPPLAVATVAPPIGTTGVTTFVANAAGTTDDVDAPAALTYEWDWEDDGTFDDTGASANHVYPAAGNYTVALRVTDSGGLIDHAVFVLVVADASDRIVVTTELDEADDGATPAAPGGDGLSLHEAIEYANGVGGTATVEVPAGMVIVLSLPQPSPVGIDIVGDGAAIDGNGQAACINSPSDSVVAGFDLYGCVIGVDLRSTSGSQVTRVHAHDTSWGIAAGSGNSIGPDNDLSACDAGVMSTGALEIWRNRIHDNLESGIDHRSGAAGTTIWQNVVWNNDYGIWLGTQSDFAQVVYNTVVGNSSDGLFTSTNGTDLDVRGNILAHNGGVGVFGADSRFTFLDYNAYFQNTGGACGNCTPGTNHTTDDPMFVNAGAGDYRLLPTSTLIDAGLDLGLDVNDREPLLFNGTAPDIGAYEAP